MGKTITEEDFIAGVQLLAGIRGVKTRKPENAIEAIITLLGGGELVVTVPAEHDWINELRTTYPTAKEIARVIGSRRVTLWRFG